MNIVVLYDGTNGRRQSSGDQPAANARNWAVRAFQIYEFTTWATPVSRSRLPRVKIEDMDRTEIGR